MGMAKSGNSTALVAGRRKRSGLIGGDGRLLDRHYNYTTIHCFLTLAGGAFPPRYFHEVPTWLKLVAQSALLLAIKNFCSSRPAHIFSIRAICVSTNDNHTLINVLVETIQNLFQTGSDCNEKLGFPMWWLRDGPVIGLGDDEIRGHIQATPKVQIYAEDVCFTY